MRVAVIISGLIDRMCVDSIKENIINPYGADTFVVSAEDNISEEELVQIWNPTSMWYGNFPTEVESRIEGLQTYPKSTETNLNSFVKMCWGIYTANRLREDWQEQNGFRYNWVVRCRPDLMIQNQLVIKGDDLWIPIGFDNNGGYNDTFAYGNDNSMACYSRLYNNIKYLADKGSVIHPESLLKENLEMYYQKIWRWHYPIQLRGMKLNEIDYKQK